MGTTGNYLEVELFVCAWAFFSRSRLALIWLRVFFRISSTLIYESRPWRSLA